MFCKSPLDNGGLGRNIHPPLFKRDFEGGHHSQGDALTRSPRATMKRPMRGSHYESACQFVVGCTHSNVKPI